MRFRYGGDAKQTYPQYLDAAKGSTLVAEPGGTYDIAPVEGLTVPGEPDKDGGARQVDLDMPMPPDDRWSAERTRVKES